MPIDPLPTALTTPVGRRSDDRESGFSLQIAIPFYKSEQLVEPLIGSLIECADELRALGAEIIFFNDSPNYPPLTSALERALPRANAALCCRLETNPENLGFIRTMNLALSGAAAQRRDIVILNSDTLIFPGAISEMVRVSKLDPMIGFVNPRSNNATLATLPHQPRFRNAAPRDALASAKTIAAFLPDYSYVPTAVGFCLLIRWQILAEFGVFDEIYGQGYNEENDLIMRAGRCGYRAVLANKAFVWHAGEQSFAASDRPRADREAVNRDILLDRYPEYEFLTAAYFDSPEYHAEVLLGTSVPDDTGRIDLAFDFSSFGAYHNGTFKAGEQVLREAARHWSDKFNLYVLCSEAAYSFHGYAALGISRRDPHGPERYAFVFRVGQPFDWSVIQRHVIKAAAFGLYMLDTIAIDCGQLYLPRIFNIWQFALEHADFIATTSELTTAQLERRFVINPDAVRARVMHSLNPADYEMPPPAPLGSVSTQPVLKPGYILVIGNHFPHKFVGPTTDALGHALPADTIVSLGVPETTMRVAARPSLPNITRIEAGDLSEESVSALFSNARLVVFPSHYEGFGLPIFNALAAKRPIFVRRTEVAEEIARELSFDSNIHLYDTTADLIELLNQPVVWADMPVKSAPQYGTEQAALLLRAGIEEALAKMHYSAIVRRIRAFQLADTISDPYASDPNSVPARIIALHTQRILTRVFRIPLVFHGTRLAYRTARKLYRGLRNRP